MLEVKIYITLKKTVADPQGLTIKHALESLGYHNLGEIRIGKLISMKVNSRDRKVVGQRIEEMCQKLLANPIIEDYTFEIEEVK